MEATNQLYARHNYDNFLSQLGVSARFSGKISKAVMDIDHR
jgi:hypothetical protein